MENPHLDNLFQAPLESLEAKVKKVLLFVANTAFLTQKSQCSLAELIFSSFLHLVPKLHFGEV